MFSKTPSTHPVNKRNASFAVLTLSALLISGFASAAHISQTPAVQAQGAQQSNTQNSSLSSGRIINSTEQGSDSGYEIQLAGSTKGGGGNKKNTTTTPTATASHTPTATASPSPTTTPTATTSPSPTATATASPTPTATTVAPSAETSIEHKLKFGVAVYGGPSASAELDDVAAKAGENPSMILFYKDFTQPFPSYELTAASNRGATPVLTWEPWIANGNVNQADYSLDNIAAGKHDAYIKQWAAGMKSYGKPIMLRFAHEMNGNWYPWSEGVNSNGSGDYIKAWQHVHDVVAAEGVTNVSWVWAPNAPYYGSVPMNSLYPGANYVDVVALDGYNWGTTQSWGSTWQTPQQVFGQGITELRQFAPGKPILIAETASAEQGGSKAEWNSSLISYLSAQPDVMGFIWFNLNKEVDWRIESSASSQSAFSAALDGRP